jgi:hypothetical protein
MAMQNAGKLQEGDEPNSEQLASGMNRLNDLINIWQTSGLKLWQTVDLPVTLTAGLACYTGASLGAVRNLRVLQAYYLDASGVRRPLLPLSWDEYNRLSAPGNQGPINSYFVDKQLSQLRVCFWLTPDATAATGTAHLIVQQQIPNVSGLLDTINFPSEWFLALQWGLAAEICTGQPDSIINRCETKALTYKLGLESWDVEDASTSFSPDQRSGQLAGGFR